MQGRMKLGGRSLACCATGAQYRRPNLHHVKEVWPAAAGRCGAKLMTWTAQSNSQQSRLVHRLGRAIGMLSSGTVAGAMLALARLQTLDDHQGWRSCSPNKSNRAPRR